MSFRTIPHASFPFDDSPWIPHFRDAAKSNARAQAGAAAHADSDGSDLLAAHILGTPSGQNPFATFKGPIHEGARGQQFAPDPGGGLYEEYFGKGRTMPGGLPPSDFIPGSSGQLRPPGSIYGPTPGATYGGY